MSIEECYMSLEHMILDMEIVFASHCCCYHLWSYKEWYRFIKAKERYQSDEAQKRWEDEIVPL